MMDDESLDVFEYQMENGHAFWEAGRQVETNPTVSYLKSMNECLHELHCLQCPMIETCLKVVSIDTSMYPSNNNYKIYHFLKQR